MAMHNDTCGCADCGNYGQPYNPGAIHNQSCGCAACGNYPQSSHVQSVAAQPTPALAGSTSQNLKKVAPQSAATLPASEVEMVAMWVDLFAAVRALIARLESA
jgi:hypothetical protein